MGVRVARILAAVAVAVAAVLVPVGPASAAEHDDGFTVWSTDRCGSAQFVDHGPGEPGSGGNDDYVLVRDHCDDGYEVKVDGWLGWSWLGAQYVEEPAAGAVFWDPFAEYGDLYRGDRFNLGVCQYDRSQDASGYLGFNCRYQEKTMVDG